MSRLSILAPVALLLALATAGCGHRQAGWEQKFRLASGRLPDPPPYRIRVGDVVEIGLWGEEMTKRIAVGPDGRISYFLATEVLASGCSLKELRGLLQEILKKHGY